MSIPIYITISLPRADLIAIAKLAEQEYRELKDEVGVLVHNSLMRPSNQPRAEDQEIPHLDFLFTKENAHYRGRRTVRILETDFPKIKEIARLEFRTIFVQVAYLVHSELKHLGLLNEESEA